jgi:uncharacterized protein YqeY
MKARMRADLRAAMKGGRAGEAKLLRVLVAAIDNAEAPPVEADRSVDSHQFHEGSAEVERLSLSPAQLRGILLAEISEREDAAAEMHRLARPDHADALRAEVELIRRYVD